MKNDKYIKFIRKENNFHYLFVISNYILPLVR